MSTTNTIRAHAQEVLDKLKIVVGCQSGRKVVTHNSRSDLPLSHIVLLRSRFVKRKMRQIHNQQNKRTRGRKWAECGAVGALSAASVYYLIANNATTIN